MQTKSTAVHPGGLTATQALAFFHSNGIEGVLIRRNKKTELRAYTCLTRYLDGSVDIAEHRIQAMPDMHKA